MADAPAKKTAAKTPAKKAAPATKAATKFSAEERAAMKEYAQELTTTAKRGGKPTREDGEKDVQASIAKMPGLDRELAEKLHALIASTAPQLAPKTWYGMPAYALDGNVVCFFQNASKFKARYATLGFSDKAQLDDGDAWPVAYAITSWTPAVEKKIAALLKKALR
jgi:uncharacterized protein YdhG (YjbR/CyaY superfamily)